MKVFRIVLGVLVAGYAVFEIFPLYATIAFKMGTVPTGDAVRMVPLWHATEFWLITLWGVVVLLMLLTAWRLFRGGMTFPVYAIAFALNLVVWGAMKMQGAYDQVLTSGEQVLNYVVLVGLAAVGAAIWRTERIPGAHLKEGRLT